MSYFLFINPSVLYGAARTLDLFSVFDDYNVSLTPAQADWLALQNDSLKVYKDFWKAYENCTKDLDEFTDTNGEFQEAETEELSLAR